MFLEKYLYFGRWCLLKKSLGSWRWASSQSTPHLIQSCGIANELLLVVLPDSFRGMGARRNSTDTQQSGHAPRSGLEIKDGRSSAKAGPPDRLKCGTFQEVGI